MFRSCKCLSAIHLWQMFSFSQCLLMLMDSPLNRAGLLQVYIHTEKNALIEINPQTRIPRTFPRFCGLMGKLPMFCFFLCLDYTMLLWLQSSLFALLLPCPYSLCFSSAVAQAERQGCRRFSEASKDDQEPSVWPPATRLPPHMYLLFRWGSSLSSYCGSRRTSCSGDRSICTRSGKKW